MSVDRWNLASGSSGDLMCRLTEGINQHRLALLLLLFLNVADMLTTQMGLSIGIPEGNPIPAMLLATGGLLAMHTAKILTMGTVVLAVCLLGSRYPKVRLTFPITNTILFLVVASNCTLLIASI